MALTTLVHSFCCHIKSTLLLAKVTRPGSGRHPGLHPPLRGKPWAPGTGPRRLSPTTRKGLRLHVRTHRYTEILRKPMLRKPMVYMPMYHGVLSTGARCASLVFGRTASRVARLQLAMQEAVRKTFQSHDEHYECPVSSLRPSLPWLRRSADWPICCGKIDHALLLRAPSLPSRTPLRGSTESPPIPGCPGHASGPPCG